MAFIIDSIILFAVEVLLFFSMHFYMFFVSPVITWLYYILMEGSGWHATLGKRMMGLYIADSKGNGITYSTAILRMIGKLLTGFTLGIGYLMGLFNEQKQCLHDMIAKTYVFDGQVSRESYAQNAMLSSGSDSAMVVGVTGPLAGMTYHVGRDGLIMGRDSVSCKVVLPSTQNKVSRVHCYVTYNPMSDMFVLNDRNSTHGTFLVNGSRVSCTQPVALKRGDRFYLATLENTFEVR